MAVMHNWSFVEALYFSFVTSLTVGYGDQNWNGDPAPLFISCYMMVSTMAISVAIQNLLRYLPM